MKGSCRADGSRGSTAIRNVCAYSVRTLRREDDLDRLIDVYGHIKWEVNGLYGTHRQGEGLSELKGGYWMYEIGKAEDNPDAEGLAFLIHKKIKDCVTNFRTFRQSNQNESKPTKKRFSYSDKCLFTNI